MPISTIQCPIGLRHFAHVGSTHTKHAALSIHRQPMHSFIQFVILPGSCCPSETCRGTFGVKILRLLMLPRFGIFGDKTCRRQQRRWGTQNVDARTQMCFRARIFSGPCHSAIGDKALWRRQRPAVRPHLIRQKNLGSRCCTLRHVCRCLQSGHRLENYVLYRSCRGRMLLKREGPRR